jgi:leucyl aminopeptidase
MAMQLRIVSATAALRRTPLLAVLACEGEKVALPAGVALPELALREFKGERNQHRLADALQGPAERVLLVGLGKLKDLDAERLRRAGAQAVKKAEALKLDALVLACPAALAKAADTPEASGRALAEGAVMGAYAYQKMKSKPTARHLKSVELRGPGARFAAGAELGRTLALANCFARDLQNTPANHLTPRMLAAEAQKLARGARGVRCKVLDEPALEKLGAGLLLAVSKGSEEPCRLIHLTYKPKGRARGVVAFIGKGLTFDAGGISLKPAAKMDEMKYDMSGAAAVLGLFHALAELGSAYEVHGVIATSENLPDGKAIKPGDVITALNGTTVEVLNTDAEGRLVLADALSYVRKVVDPEVMIDLATLTGAVVTALGHEYSGLFASTPKLRDALVAAGERVGERLWALPLEEHHKDQMKSQVADLRNINDPSHGGGSSAGAAFLAPFAGTTAWAHLDIAGTAWGSMNRDWVGGAGGSGVGVRLLYEYLQQRG